MTNSSDRGNAKVDKTVPLSDSPENPLVSIGLPVFNGEAFLEQAIRSLQSQTYQNLDLILSDNFSTDRTEEICNELARSDPRIRYTRTDRNIGAAANFNRVARMARGEFFAWANHDDLWDPTYVARCVEELIRDQDAVLSYARSEKIDETGSRILILNAGLELNASDPKERLNRYHRHFIDIDRRKGWGKEPIEGLWIPVYGLIRTRHLLRTSLIGNYIASDTILIEQMLMLGKFIEIEERLFFKRDHKSRSMRDSDAYDARAEWFSGKRPARLLFPYWRAFRERVFSAVRLPNLSRDKRRCVVEMFFFYVRRRSERNALVKEILANIVRLILGTKMSARYFPKW